MSENSEPEFRIEGLAPPPKKSATTEREILACLKDNLLLARDCCVRLHRGERGDVFLRFREAIKLVYGATRQVAGWREDARWLPFGVYVCQVEEKCRQWLVDKHGNRYFGLLADILEQAYVRARELETKKTGKAGMILPVPQPAPTRTQGRSILVPPGFKDIRTVN